MGKSEINDCTSFHYEMKSRYMSRLLGVVEGMAGLPGHFLVQYEQWASSRHFSVNITSSSYEWNWCLIKGKIKYCQNIFFLPAYVLV